MRAGGLSAVGLGGAWVLVAGVLVGDRSGYGPRSRGGVIWFHGGRVLGSPVPVRLGWAGPC